MLEGRHDCALLSLTPQQLRDLYLKTLKSSGGSNNFFHRCRISFRLLCTAPPGGPNYPRVDINSKLYLLQHHPHPTKQTPRAHHPAGVRV